MLLVATLGNRTENVLQLFAAIIVFVIVLFVTYVVTKWIGNYQSVHMKNNNIEVIDTMRIANGKLIQIVKIAGEYVAIAVCKDTVTFLTKLDEEKINDLRINSEANNESFQDIIKKLKNIKK